MGGEAPRPIAFPAAHGHGSSDLLRALDYFVRQNPAAWTWLPPVRRISAVLDATVLLRDAMYAARPDRVGMRPATEELIDCGVLPAYVPDVVIESAERDLPRLLAQRPD